jgi:putative hydrolases of HD superfamily
LRKPSLFPTFRKEYEDQTTPESLFVKGWHSVCCATHDRSQMLDLDRFEMSCQCDETYTTETHLFKTNILADEYEKRHTRTLQSYFDSSIPNIRDPEIKQWGSDLLKERDRRAAANK